MLRIVHAQKGSGPIRIDDIDDGLPNKTPHRLGSTADPAAYKRDGYAQEPKQPCYVPFAKPTDPAIPGYVDLRETQRVLHSAGKGKIKGFQDATLVTVVTFSQADLAAPVVAAASINVPNPGDLTITGTNLASVYPNTSTVVLTGVGAVTLTEADITTGGGSVADGAIVIPAALVPGIAAAVTFAQVLADDHLSAPPVAVA